MPIKERLSDPLSGTIPASEVSEALKLYGLDSGWVIMPLVGRGTNIYAINRRSQTTKKAFIKQNGGFYVMKQLPWYCASDNFANYSTEFQQELSRHGLPVPELLRARDGKRWVHVVAWQNKSGIHCH